jgi:hypothetical protein
VLEDRQAVWVLQVLIQAHAGTALTQDACQRGLAHLDRLSAQVGAVQLQQVEGLEERLRLVPPMAQELEVGHAPLVATHHLAVGSRPPPQADSAPTSHDRPW